MPPSHRSVPRRSVLQATVGLSALGLTGCLGQPTSGSRADSPTETREPNPETPERVDASSAAWPQFGAGHRNTGHAPTATGPGPTDPELAWRYDAGTPTMNASPVVADGTVYVPGSGDPGLIHAVDVASGDKVWEFEPAGYTSSAPALHEGTLYVGTWGKQFYAVDAESGDEVWHREIGHRFGSSSPVVDHDTVYVGTVGDGPLVVRGAEDEGEFEACAFLALDSSSGDVRWRYDEFGEKDNIHSSPALADGRVFFGGEDALYALEADTGDVAWTREIPTHQDASPAVSDGRVYYGAPDHEESEAPARVWALDAASGDTLWSEGIDDVSLRTSPAVADGTVFVAASSRRVCLTAGGDDESNCSGVDRGQLYAFDAASGDRLWTAEIVTDTRSSPAVADGIVYVGCGDGLSAVTTDGETAWRKRFESEHDDLPYVKSSPAVAAGHVFVGASDGRLRAFRGAESGYS